ncbi:MAG: phage holin family protein [Acetobacteraceae bacterium]|nr:phage holin family protein [Acetobacteraceae bacterium]
MSGSRQEGPQHSLGEIVGGLATDIQDLVRGEIALARAELDQKLDRVIMAAIWLLGGALVAFAGLVVVLQGAAAALALVLPTWAASLIIGVVIVIIGALFARSGLAMLSLRTLTPDRTAASLQKDARIVKEHT